MTNSVTIRRATEKDIPAICSLAKALVQQHVEYDPARYLPPQDVTAAYTELLERQMSESDAVILVADRDGQLVGYVFGQVEPPSLVSLTRSTGWIHDLYVSPDARGLGAGGKLLDQAIQAFQLIGPAGGIMLAVASQNAAAATLFQARGFRPTLQEMTLSPLPSC